MITVNGVSRNATDDEKAEMEKYMQQYNERMSTEMFSGMRRMFHNMRKMFNNAFWGRGQDATAELDRDNSDNTAESQLSQSQNNQTQEWPLSGFSNDMLQAPSFCKQALKAQKEEGQEPAEQKVE